MGARKIARETKIVWLICLTSGLIAAAIIWGFLSWANSVVAPQPAPTSQLQTI